MDTCPADYIRHRIIRFSDAIGETKKQFPHLSVFGKCSASAPYYEKHGILLLLESIRKNPGSCDELMQEFEQALTKLAGLEEELGEPYRRLLRDELRACMDIYSAAVCHANIGTLRFESDHELFRRDRITVLVHELEKDHDLTDTKNLIRQMDANLFPATGYTGVGLPDNPSPEARVFPPQNNGDRIES